MSPIIGNKKIDDATLRYCQASRKYDEMRKDLGNIDDINPYDSEALSKLCNLEVIRDKSYSNWKDTVSSEGGIMRCVKDYD